MTNYYNSLCNSRDTVYKKSKFGASGGSPNTTKTSRWWLASLFMVMSLFMGQFANAQVGSYTFAQSTGTYTDLASPTVLATATENANNPGNLDDVIYAIPSGSFPFSFTFDNVAYTGCQVSTNGFITFGTTAPSSTNYTPLSSTATYAGAIAAWGGDANSPFALGGKTGSISWAVEGTAPNREVVIQWKDVRPAFTTSTTLVPYINYQIRLKETTNTIAIVYGTTGIAVGTTNSSTTRQIGLRGPNNTFATSVKNRTNATTVAFGSSTAGTSNTSTQAYSSVNATPGKPTSGLTYTFTPPPPPACGTASGLAISDNLTGTTVDLAWTAPTIGPPVSYDWEIRTTGAGGSGATGLTAFGNVSATSVNDAGTLVQGTAYNLYVRTNCGANGLSTWVGPTAFTTVKTCPSGLGAGSLAVTLPYNGTGLTNSGAGNNVTATNVACVSGSTNYYGAEDKTYIFTSTLTGPHTIDLTTTTDDDAGIMLYQGCPFTPGSVCVANAQSTAGLTRNITANLTAGLTYYLVVDNWTAPAFITSYTLSIVGPPTLPPNCATGLLPADLSSDLARNPTLSWTAATGSPTSYDVYLGTTSGSLTLAGNVTGLSYTTALLAPNQTYYWSVVPKNANGDAVGCIEQSFTTGTSFNYCSTGLTTTGGTGDVITGVTVGSYSSGAIGTNAAPWYTSVNNTPITLNTSTTQSIDITFGTDGSQHSAVWVDFDQDGTFSAAENVALSTTAAAGSSTVTYNMAIPASATAGLTRMRVRGGSDSAHTAAGACAGLAYGETEDYVVNVVITPPCSGAPAAAVASASVAGACVGVPFTLSVTGQTNGLGITYQWESADDAGFTTGVTALGTGINEVIASQTAAKFYRFSTTCSTGPDTTYSNVVQVTQNAPTQCYCTPVYTFGKTSGDLISNISITGTALSNNSGTAQTNPAYTFFEGQPNYTAELQAGGSYSVNVTVGTWGSQAIKAWIDYDDDGIFESTEVIGSSVIAPGQSNTGPFPPASFSISLSCDPPVGEHRLRVRSIWNAVAASIDPCASGGFGETEDYLVTITAPDPCPAPKNLAVTAGTITSEGATVTWTLGCAETVWDVFAQPVGAPAPTGTTTPTVSGLTATTHIFTGLDPETAYNFYVRAACDSANNVYSVWSLPSTFTTVFSCTSAIVLSSDVPVTSGNLAIAGGSYNITSCGFSTPGKEKLYSFTSTNAGDYILEVTNTNGGTGYVDYFFKDATLGCDATGWSCIDDNNATGTDVFTLAANTTYFILLDPESATGTANHTFKISPVPPAPGCATVVSPIDGATGVDAGDVTITWSAPAVTATEGAATSYNVFFGTTSGALTNIGTVTGTSANIINLLYTTQYFWSVVPTNAGGSAVGCVESSFTTGTDPFLPYCSTISFTSNVEPITSVVFAGINNSSSNVVGGTPGLQNFVSTTGNVNSNSSYTMTLKGNSDGNFTNNFRVFADWNQDGDFADAGETYNAGSITNSTGLDAISAVSNIAVPISALPGTTRLRVKKLFGTTSIDDSCVGGGFGQVEDYTLNVTGFTTSVKSPVCGSTLANVTSLVQVFNFSASANITGYRFKATGPSGDLIVEKTTPHFQFTDLPGWQYGTTYTVSCELQAGGVWAGYYGPTCTISTPNVVALGLSQVVSPSCGSTVSVNATISTTSLAGATGYRFKVTNTTLGYAGTNAVQIIDRTVQWFKLNQLAEYVYGSSYTVEVAVKTTGSYGSFGLPCTFITASPVIGQCGTTVSAGSLISSTSLAGVTQYSFEVTNLTDSSVQSIVRTVPHFSTSLITGYSTTTSYSVSVAVTSTGVQSPYSQACVINPSAAVREVDSSYASELKVKAFPNPFTNNFTLAITRASEENVSVMVYDMIGKLLDKVTVNATDNSLELGANYPAGVYNVVVSQGEKVETVRMIKQ